MNQSQQAAARAAFEADFAARHGYPLNVRRKDDGRYGDHHAQDLWETWLAALASSPQPAEPAEKESQCTNGTLNTWQSQLDTAASGATPTRDATSAALAAPASSIQAGNSPESGSIQAEVPPGPFDHLAGRGLHELRFDELTPYVLTILEDPAAVEAAVAWIVSELTRKTNDERILAVQLAALREAASPPSAPAQVPGWQSIAEAPEGELLVVFWLDDEDTETPERYDFDHLDDGVWQKHAESVEHFEMVAPPESRGPKRTAPYTHFLVPGVPVSAPTVGKEP